jgi:site-specific DNA-methyltransferase (adenine-specific)
MDNDKLESILWDSANKLRGGLSAADYMHVVLGLIFLKYLSDKFNVRYQELLKEGKGYENDKDEYIQNMVFWIPEKSRWEYISKYSNSEELGKVLDEAFIEIEKENSELKNILPKTYSKLEVDQRRLGELIDLFTNKLDLKDSTGDFIGQVYEYFLGKFARNLGQKGGEFYTPRCVVELLVNMIEPYSGKVYDPCCGSGGMFVQSANFVKEHQGNVDSISVYGQELNATTWRLAKMNLVIRGIDADLGDSNADTFHNDKHKALRADYILANPPFNIKDYGQPQLLEDPRWKYDIPPAGNANYAWIQHMISKLSPKGVAGFVLANGSLSSSTKQEYNIRKKMIEDNIVDCIISLPDKLFSTFKGSVCLWFLRKQKTNNDILFMDLRDLGEMVNTNTRELLPDEIIKISSIYHNWLTNENYADIEGFCKSTDINEIKNNDYSLVPGRYVGVATVGELSEEQINEEIKKIKIELKDLFKKSDELKEKITSIIE